MSCKKPGRRKGFTLIEILVVLIIIAVMAALLVFTFHDSTRQQLHREAAGFAALLNAAAEEAVMRGIEIGVVLDDEGYRFVTFDPETKQWQAADKSGLAEHNFPEHYTIDFTLDGDEVDERTIERIKLLAQRSEDEHSRPSILILSSGEITPFKLTLHAQAKTGLSDEAAQSSDAISLHCDGLNPVAIDTAAAEKDRS
jgi:general secretion pathway protein H